MQQFKPKVLTNKSLLQQFSRKSDLQPPEEESTLSTSQMAKVPFLKTFGEIKQQGGCLCCTYKFKLTDSTQLMQQLGGYIALRKEFVEMLNQVQGKNQYFERHLIDRISHVDELIQTML